MCRISDVFPVPGAPCSASGTLAWTARPIAVTASAVERTSPDACVESGSVPFCTEPPPAGESFSQSVSNDIAPITQATTTRADSISCVRDLQEDYGNLRRVPSCSPRPDLSSSAVEYARTAGTVRVPHQAEAASTLFGHPATRTRSLPKLRPSSKPMKASGARSSPSTTSSRYFIRPSRIHADMSR